MNEAISRLANQSAWTYVAYLLLRTAVPSAIDFGPWRILLLASQATVSYTECETNILCLIYQLTIGKTFFLPFCYYSISKATNDSFLRSCGRFEKKDTRRLSRRSCSGRFK